MNTLFKLPGGRSIPMQRAIAMGLASADGSAAAPAPDSQAAKLLAKEQRKADWAARQAKTNVKRRRVQTTEVEAPETTIDGRMKRRKKEPDPLRPQNVKDGEPITDEETLAEIAAKTAAIEAAQATEEVEA